MALQVEHDVAVHLHEAAVAVPGEALVARLLGERLHRLVVEADVEHGVHHARHRVAGTGAAGEQQRVRRIAELGPHRLFDLLERLFDLGLEFGGYLLAVGVEVGADFGGDGEAGRDGQADVGHFGEVGPFAAEQVLHVGVAISLAVAEEIDVLGHGLS